MLETRLERRCLLFWLAPEVRYSGEVPIYYLFKNQNYKNSNFNIYIYNIVLHLCFIIHCHSRDIYFLVLRIDSIHILAVGYQKPIKICPACYYCTIYLCFCVIFYIFDVMFALLCLVIFMLYGNLWACGMLSGGFFVVLEV
jgi:hypothetical protein